MVNAESESDFVNEMYAAVVEEAALWELPGGATDLLPNGSVTHGPWEPAACAALIARWVERGWVELYLPKRLAQSELTRSDWETRGEQRGDFLIVAHEDALHLLGDPTRWTVDTADGQASLSKTDIGLAIPAGDWLS